MTFQLIGTVVRDLSGEALRGLSALAVEGLRRVVPLPRPVPTVPRGRMMELPGRGHTFVVDVPGPTPDAPTVLLLHALGTTAYLTWYTALADLAQHYRVVTLDLRWHGRGIVSDRFRVADCADDAAAALDVVGVDQAIAVGYSLGGAVAQELWHRHPERVSGLVLCSTSAKWRVSRHEQRFFPVLDAAMGPLSKAAVGGLRRRVADRVDLPSVDSGRFFSWGWAELRSTSAWTAPEVLCELGRFDSTAWLPDVDVPTTVLVTTRDLAVAPERQRALAAAIPEAVVMEAPGGHVSLFLGSERWLPLFLEAVSATAERVAVLAATSPRRAGSATGRGRAG